MLLRYLEYQFQLNHLQYKQGTAIEILNAIPDQTTGPSKGGNALLLMAWSKINHPPAFQKGCQ